MARHQLEQVRLGDGGIDVRLRGEGTRTGEIAPVAVGLRVVAPRGIAVGDHHGEGCVARRAPARQLEGVIPVRRPGRGERRDVEIRRIHEGQIAQVVTTSRLRGGAVGEGDHLHLRPRADQCVDEGLGGLLHLDVVRTDRARAVEDERDVETARRGEVGIADRCGAVRRGGGDHRDHEQDEDAQEDGNRSTGGRKPHSALLGICPPPSWW
jgi:hypothetical protein